MFKPLFAERLLVHMASCNQLKPHHFDTDQAMLSDTGRKLVVQTVRDEFAVTVMHRPRQTRGRRRTALLRRSRSRPHCLEDIPCKPFRIWW
ncbi:hypothetical protein ACIP5N_05205 [Streptomyces sp. NPDC088768]|uniref:hypothetical protein n=1 Tax=Streptomyces sp. NPDC088768 TaxID=3365894 RepID=UPI003814509C